MAVNFHNPWIFETDSINYIVRYTDNYFLYITIQIKNKNGHFQYFEPDRLFFDLTTQFGSDLSKDLICDYRIAGCLSAITRKRNPSAKKNASEATATLIVPPASFTAAIIAEPRKEAPLLNIS